MRQRRQQVGRRLQRLIGHLLIDDLAAVGKVKRMTAGLVQYVAGVLEALGVQLSINNSSTCMIVTSALLVHVQLSINNSSTRT